MLAGYKLALNAGRDHELQAIELQGLMAPDFDIELTGFSAAEIDPMSDEVLEGLLALCGIEVSEDYPRGEPTDPVNGAITQRLMCH